MLGRRASARRRASAIPIAWFVLAGCPDTPTDPAPSTTPTEHKAEFRAKAHVDAYARLVPLAQKALDLADPLGEAAIMNTVPRPRAFSVGARVAIRKAVDAAWIEAADIRAEYLPPENALLLRAIRFALGRLRDEQERRPATRVDPGVGVRATAALLDEAVLRGPGCDGCDDAFAAAGLELDAATSDLGATSPTRARAAADDCAMLRERLGAWRRAHSDPDAQVGAAALDAALERNRERLIAIAVAIGDAPIAPVDKDGIRPPRPGAAIVRLPDRLGAAELRRWLDVHESESRAAKALFAALAPAATQLGMFATTTTTTTAPEATAVDAARCKKLWAELETFAKSQPAVVAQLDCDATRTRLWLSLGLGERATDDEVRVALVHWGIVLPTRRGARSRTDASLARVTGDIAPESHRHALAVALLSGAKQPGARQRAAAAAQAQVCTTMIALWTHGELGDDAAMREAVAKPCAGIDVGPTVDAVLARPYASFGGLGLMLLAQGPADIVALERGWWLPLGLVVPAARPQEPPTDAKVEIHTEEIEPGVATEPTPRGSTPP